MVIVKNYLSKSKDYVAIRERLENFSGKFGLQKDDVSDVVSDVLYKSMNKSFTNEKTLISYLFVGTRNKSIDFCKSKKKTEINCDIENLMTFEDQTAIAILDSGSSKGMHNLLTTLSYSTRQIVYKYYWESMSIVDISKELRIPSVTIRSRLSRARKILRRKLETITDDNILSKSCMTSIIDSINEIGDEVANARMD